MNLVSPEYDLRKFCSHMHGKDPLAIMEAASSEIYFARNLHRRSSGGSVFRKGSKGRNYCDNLQLLVSMLMNGSVPNNSDYEFLITVKPLVMELLKMWEIGGLRQTFSGIREKEDPSLPKEIDPLVIVVPRSDVKAMDISATIRALGRLTESPATARDFVERVDIAFHGYDHTPEELFEIPEVRNYIYKLDEQFPFWFYFLSKRHLGLQCLYLCFLPPFLTDVTPFALP